MISRSFVGLIVATSMGLLSVPIEVQAQTRIGDLQNVAVNAITVAGRVTSVVGNSFILDDGTGQIIVDAGPRWYQQVNVSQGEQVTVLGELGRGELDAFSITKANGDVINIRPVAPGPPPWAGGPSRRR